MLLQAAAPAVTTSPIDTTAKSGCAPGASNLNYTCRTDQAGLQIHWSVNTTYPPENLCTGSRTGFSEPPNDGSGRLHMAVVGRVQGESHALKRSGLNLLFDAHTYRSISLCVCLVVA